MWRFIFYHDPSFAQTIHRKKKDVCLAVGISFNPNFDGNALAWYDGNFGLSNTLWEDQGAGGHDIVFANTPSIISGSTPLRDAVRFDGVDQNGTIATPTTNQPYTIYIVLNQITYVTNDVIYSTGGGTGFNIRRLDQRGGTPNLRFTTSGVGTISSNPDTALGTYGVMTVVADGLNGAIRTNLNAAVTGDVGANDSAGITLGSRSNSASFANFETGYLIIRTGADSTAIQNRIITALRDICGLTF